MKGEELEKALEELGRTATDVAASLSHKGIRGKKASMGACPLACYLQGLAPDQDVLVGNVRFCFDEEQEGYGAVRRAGTLPRACQMFVDRFDEGGYPELEEEAPRGDE